MDLSFNDGVSMENEATFGSYNDYIKRIRDKEYPMLKGNLYLDHAGSTLYARSVVEKFSADLLENLYGNPHAASASSQLSTRRIDDIRHDILHMFNADSNDFDLVFVANATAGIKLITQCFASHENGFWYGYHKDSHTSLVGAREGASAGHCCFESDKAMEDWIADSKVNDAASQLELLAYPAQSNLNGRRLPVSWCRQLRESTQATRRRYSLLDAAAFCSTSPLDFSDIRSAPDFTVLSFYKIFGFPDLGGVIVRKDSSDVLRKRAYFGGGTVDAVVSLKEQWHMPKSGSIHESLEDGTLPFHNIMALKHAMSVYNDMFTSLKQTSKHTLQLAKCLYEKLSALRHSNGVMLCKIYQDHHSDYSDSSIQGPIVAFNMRNSQEQWISNTEVEKLTTLKNIHIRSGGLCNPGGIASSLGLEPWEIGRNFMSGNRCGGGDDVMYGKPTGMLRVSVGAMSTVEDVDHFVGFLQEFFVESRTEPPPLPVQFSGAISIVESLYIESLTIYPIKSCAGWKVPADQAWKVRREGLAWDREWCLVHNGTGKALTQKHYPRMALIRSALDLETGVLRVRFTHPQKPYSQSEEICVPLSANPSLFADDHSQHRTQASNVCGDDIRAQVYTCSKVSGFFTSALGVPCQLARYPAAPADGSLLPSRHSKAHLQRQHGSDTDKPANDVLSTNRPILLSNESPILTISRSSLNRLNEQIKARGGKAAQAEVFRANIVIASDLSIPPGLEQPYVEDRWRVLQIGKHFYQMLGPCRRCQMVCVDQETAEKNEEPFVTLSKTRRSNGKVWFGQHTCHLPLQQPSSLVLSEPTLTVGQPVRAFTLDDAETKAMLQASSTM